MKINLTKGIAFTLVFIVFLVYSLTVLYSLFWLLNNSFKTLGEWDESRFAFAVQNLKNGALFDNYFAAWNELDLDGVGVPGMLFNSLWYSIGGAFVGVWFCGLTAYIVSKYRFIGRELIYGVAIFQMLLPIVGNLPATYKMYFDLGIVNSPLLLITSAGGLGGNFLILYASYQSVSDTYMEAARIDGAGHIAIFFKIMMPQVIPAMFALMLMGYIGLWNDYMGPLLYLEEFPTLATGLMIFEKEMTYDMNMPVFFAGSVILLTPTLILFAVFSDKIMTNVSTGGLKG
ncbi:MAG: carbohydrate ABC transporter permease [Clostridia bacterium]|nr:carbohydrate ABC transporter permease [Clostridia bacterium]